MNKKTKLSKIFFTENYRLQSKYENHLIAKVAIFQFVNSFLSLFYIAFYLRDEEKLKEQLAGLLISRQIIGNLRESAWPYMVEQWKLATLSFNMWGALSPSQETAPSELGNIKKVSFLKCRFKDSLINLLKFYRMMIYHKVNHQISQVNNLKLLKDQLDKLKLKVHFINMMEHFLII